jgi:hypothetical protein
MDMMIGEPLIILSICIGTLNIIERILRRTTKYNKLLEKIGKSKEKLIELSHHRMSIENLSNDDNLIIDALELLDDIVDYTDINFHIPK